MDEGKDAECAYFIADYIVNYLAKGKAILAVYFHYYRLEPSIIVSSAKSELDGDRKISIYCVKIKTTN